MRRGLVFAAALCFLIGGAAFWSEGEPGASPVPPLAEPLPLPPPPPNSVRPRPVPVREKDAGPAEAGLREVVAAVEAPLDAGAPLDPTEVDAGATAIVAEAPVLVLDAGALRSVNDPRFGVRWGQTGLCGEEPLQHLAKQRAALLATFVGVRRAGTLVFHDPDAPMPFVDAVGQALGEARMIATRLLGPRADVALPTIYVYASADEMRDVACVNTATQGYYDGAIHLPATDPDAWRTVVHEHIHHVLNALGVQKPMWFHEGLAMYAADERWWEDPRLGLMTWLRSAHLPFPSLTEAFPHTADELFAGAAYYQSYQMVNFLAVRSQRADFAWFIDGAFPPQTSFSDATGLDGAALESAWRGFISSR